MLIDALGDLLGKSFEPFQGEWADKPLQILLKEMELQKAEEENKSSNVLCDLSSSICGRSCIVL